MSELDPDVVDIAPEREGAAPRMRWWQKLLIGIGLAIGASVVLAALLYNFGGMGGSANDPAMKQQYEQLVAAGRVEPVQKRFTNPIPGCTCHSDDPVQTEVHRYYHMRECMACH